MNSRIFSKIIKAYNDFAKKVEHKTAKEPWDDIIDRQLDKLFSKNEKKPNSTEEG